MSTTFYEYYFYDASGFRVSRIQTENADGGWENLLTSKHQIRFGGQTTKEWHENYGGTETGVIASSAEVSNIYAGGQVGKIRKDGSQEYYITNHQGSTMRTVGADGAYTGSNGSVIDYWAYGNEKRLKTNSEMPTETFTGKELDAFSDLHYFGARFYDADLGVWLGTDPAGQFLNPYGYGSSPLNGTDPNGAVWGWVRATGHGLAVAGRAVGHVAAEGGRATADGAVAFDRWASGTRHCDEDNVGRTMYRAAFHKGHAVLNSKTECTEEYRKNSLDVGVSVNNNGTPELHLGSGDLGPNTPSGQAATEIYNNAHPQLFVLPPPVLEIISDKTQPTEIIVDFAPIVGGTFETDVSGKPLCKSAGGCPDGEPEYIKFLVTSSEVWKDQHSPLINVGIPTIIPKKAAAQITKSVTNAVYSLLSARANVMWQKQGERKQIEYVANKYGITYDQLSDYIHDYKPNNGMRNDENLTLKQLEEGAKWVLNQP